MGLSQIVTDEDVTAEYYDKAERAGSMVVRGLGVRYGWRFPGSSLPQIPQIPPGIDWSYPWTDHGTLLYLFGA